MKNLFVSLLFAFGFSIIANAHAPKKLDVSYDATNQTIKVVIPHKVKNTKSHYIDKVVITIGEDDFVKKFTDQKTLKNHQVELKLEKAPSSGTVIKVVASCNKMGSKKAEIVVE